MLDWITHNQTFLWWLAAVSAGTFAATIMLVPLLIARLPADYFAHGKRHHVAWAGHHPLVRAILLIAKNSLGCVLIAVGVALLVLPGQGLLTILAGILLLNFPGKYKLERWFITRRPILRSVNWLRRRAGKSSLVLDK